jgi:hypothetical protein
MLILVRELAALELPALLIMSAIWGNSENIYSLRALPYLTHFGPWVSVGRVPRQARAPGHPTNARGRANQTPNARRDSTAIVLLHNKDQHGQDGQVPANGASDPTMKILTMRVSIMP